jgi:HSP20 family protein
MTLPVRRSSSAPARWDPLREFNDLQSRMDSLVQSVFGTSPFGSLGTSGELASWRPLADVSETDDAYLVEVELPGVRRDDIAIELQGGELVISGQFTEKEKVGLLRSRTRRTGSFEYRATVPGEVDADKVTAQLGDGVLTVTVPKSEAAKPRRIEITGG